MTSCPSHIFRFPEVRVVEASAGSGKTYALAKRYIQLVFSQPLHQQNTPMRHVLAITFTNKAAFEMKRRILDFLKKMALGDLSAVEEETILKPLGLSAGQAQEKAFAIMEMLVHQYNYFQVQTIDSFINALLSGCAFKIGLSANFKIKTNALEYLEYGLDQMMDRALRDAETKKVFEKFLHQYLFLENKPNWFAKKDMLALLYGLYQQGNIYGQTFQSYPIEDKALLEQKMHILALMRELKSAAAEALDGRFVKSLDKFLSQYQAAFDVDRVSDYFAREDLPVKKKADAPRRADTLWQDIRKQLKTLCEEEALTVFDPYIEIFHELSREFEQKAKKDDLLFLEELNKKAKALFDEGAVTVEELYYRLATRFHHYLMDEFQDTSLLQWENLQMMVEEALSTGGSLFYVGDKKQAIYGFRGGEMKLFDSIQQQFRSFNVCREQLGRNFRSQKAIVEFNNTVFSPANLRRFIEAKQAFEQEKKKKDPVVFSENDFQALDNIFYSSRQAHLPQHDGGVVQVEVIENERKEDRDELVRLRVLAFIFEAQKRFRLKDIALLTRSNDEIELLTRWLMEEGISVQSERTMNIRENPVVRDLTALLEFLNSPIDNCAFARFILGGVFTSASGVSKEEIQRYLLGLRVKITTEKDFYIYRDFRVAHQELWESLLDDFFRQVGLYPLYELMISILKRFDVFARFPEHQGFVMRFLELIKEQEEDHTDVASFLESFENLQNEKLYVHMTDSDAVKILTIHKSKGLEFPVVIIPFLGMRIKVGAGGGVGQLSYILDFQEQRLQLMRIKEKYLKFSGQLREIWRDEYIRSFFYELNSMYVALTRASEELYVLVPHKTGNSFNPARFLIPEECFQMGTVSGRGYQEPEEAPRFFLPPPVYHDWLAYLKEEFLAGDKVFHRQAVLRGDLLHAILSFVGNLRDAEPQDMIDDAYKQAAAFYPQLKDKGEYKDIIYKFIQQEDIKPFFFVGDGDVFQEWEAVNPWGQTRRFDRMIVRPEDIWIADFKSARDSKADYAQQMQEYMLMAREIFPKKDIRGFLLYLDTGEAEEV